MWTTIHFTANLCDFFISVQVVLQQVDHIFSINFIGKTPKPMAQINDLGTMLDSIPRNNEHIQRLSSSCISKLCQVQASKESI